MERKEQFTPGPWKAHAGILEPDFVFYGDEEKCDEENRVVCECFLCPGKHKESADVHLIAAAPEMYDLLCELVSAEERNTCDGLCLYEFAERAKKILKKARGE